MTVEVDCSYNPCWKFNGSVRTIYRDIRALEQFGVAVLTEEGCYLNMVKLRHPHVCLAEAMKEIEIHTVEDYMALIKQSKMHFLFTRSSKGCVSICNGGIFELYPCFHIIFKGIAGNSVPCPPAGCEG